MRSLVIGVGGKKNTRAGSFEQAILKEGGVEHKERTCASPLGLKKERLKKRRSDAGLFIPHSAQEKTKSLTFKKGCKLN